MAVTLAPAALARVQRYLVEAPDAIGLRFGVTRTGCSGWQYKADLTRRFWEECEPAFRDGRLRPVIDRVFPLREAAAAHRYMEENRNVGKIILTVDGE